MMGFIYKIINKVTNKIYIGQTRVPIDERFRHHISSYNLYIKGKLRGNSKLYSSMKKYGTDNFYIDLIECVKNSKLNEREIYWISELNTVEDGYNISSGGFGGPLFKGHKHNLCTKVKMSKIHKGKKQSIEFIRKRADAISNTVQNLNTGDVYVGTETINGKRRSRILASIRLGGKTENCFWCYVPKNLPAGYSFCERQMLIRELESSRRKRLVDGVLKRKNSLDKLSAQEKIERRIKFNLLRKNQWKSMSCSDRRKRILELNHFQANRFNAFLDSLGIENLKEDYLIKKLSYNDMLIKYELKPSTLDKIIRCLNMKRNKYESKIVE